MKRMKASCGISASENSLLAHLRDVSGVVPLLASMCPVSVGYWLPYGPSEHPSREYRRLRSVYFAE